MMHNQRNIEPNEKILFKNRKTISELFRIVSYAYKYVMVLSIDMNRDLYYKSCVVCYRKSVDIESKFYCANCSKDVDYPKLMYILKVLASNETGSAWFVLFDKMVEKVIGHDIEIVVELNLKVRFIVMDWRKIL
ncbi:hypothetical protein M9H77_32320 [Catharanthus roseus]|uniref:Uncharacterized protein n=1 Tax=Catharanthus roseus TaxID=4058 RepID=A0ACC0A6T8_CATRO|nr:hypothetical protein M9H77_32320 [Catharanthus roseus]